VRHLARRGIRQQLIDLPEWGPTRLPEAARDPWFETLGTPVPATAAIHFCMPHQVTPIAGVLNVNYSMFEATRIPTSWLVHNRRHDQVVVPTASSRDAWLARRFPADRIALCPLGVDPRRFRPEAEPLALTDRSGRTIRDHRVRVLNVSEPGPRKNLAALLRVWIRTTTPSEDAILIIKLARSSPTRTVQFLRDLDAVERSLGKSRRDAAPMLFYDQVLADWEMPGLFAAATHYWSMSRGEGWDQPMVEAAATGLRLLAPDHSAYPTYLDSTIAAMIPARRVRATLGDDEELAPLFRGADWWEPDEEAAGDALREAVSGADEGRPTARARVVGEFTWEHATTRLIDILAELHRRRGRPF
jgi:glycosyltransferase involved in cell wall biosynthesis